MEFLSLPVGRLLVRHASPAAASMLFQAFYQIVDGIMVGRSLGPEAMASVNVLYPVVALISGLAVMIGTGGNARIAVLLGAGHRRQAGGVLAAIIGLDYLFLFVLGFGISGAAMASGISQSIGALVFLTYFVTKTVRRRPGLRFSRPDLTLATLRAVIVNGSSELFNSVSAGVTTFLFNRVILLHIGTLGVAALTVVQYPIMLAVMIVMGIGSGTQPILSYNHGAGLQQRVRETLVRSTLVATSVGVIVFIVMGAPARALAAVFLPDHLEAQALTHEVASIVRWSVPFMPIAMIASVYFTALEQAGRSLLIALSRGLVLPIIGLVVFPLLWGATGIWITAIFAEALSVLVAMACYLSRRQSRRAPAVVPLRPTVPLAAANPE